ncbi:FAD-dependent monooxygenase [Adhaeribacter rhizoryzae]|uniref:NAD(P)-binding protein n=1 Tax=Adhaeribacter rhizoryzae TaxID=2607907 RepID=A0A5M6D7R2_9BACT|nr:FAD-dependent monooxygenase [Adhaeribacter rhizoryzae]KAA5543557.1 NAD(P)-binding protein [Adhaeribacter rhizoryzae]
MKTGIIGAGIAGLTTAIALRRQGIATEIFESAPELKAIGVGLGLAANAIKAFRHLGIAEEVIAAGLSLNSYEILDEQGRIINTTDSQLLGKRYGLNNFTIHRAELHRVLQNHIVPGTLHLNKKAINLEQLPTGTKLFFEDGSETIVDNLIIADGIHSLIRQKLYPQVQPRYAGYTCWRAVIPNPGLTLNTAVETWGIKGRFGYVPLAGNKIYWYACANAPQNSPQMQAFTILDLRKLFNQYHAPIPEMLEHTQTHQLIWNDICDLPALPQYALGNILFIGDAGHATTPNMGQGACQAIEDGVILAEAWRKNGSFAAAAQYFEQHRRARTQWVIEQSYRLGKVAHLENRFLIKLRNKAFRIMPARINQSQLDKLFRIQFE